MTALANHPEGSLPEACEGWADTKAAYRFFSNDEVAARDIISAHSQTTAKRIARHPVILAVQDTTDFNFSTHPGTKGLGPIKWGKGGVPSSLGFYTHSCLALSPDGVPQGLLAQHSWTRRERSLGTTEYERTKIPISEKETQRWLDMIKETARVMPENVRVVAVADREADIFDFFTCAIENKQDFLVRSRSDRATEDGYAWQEVADAPLALTLKVEVARNGDRAARTATIDVRVAHLKLKPPEHRRGAAIDVNIVLAHERTPPKGEEGITWRLLTSLPVTTSDEISQCVKWYSLRWRIERFHYTLKSGCRIEDLQLGTRDRIQRALAAYSIVAWYLLWLTHQARESPNASSATFLRPHEWKGLACLANKTRKPPSKPPSLRAAVRMIAKLGGFLARKNDGEPGLKVLWRGYRRFQDALILAEQLAGVA